METSPMNKTQLIEAVADKTGLPKAQTDRSVKAILEVISETLAKGEAVSLIGFGKFEVKTRTARNGRNPRTGAPMVIAAARTPKFSPGASLRKSVTPSTGKKVGRRK